MEWPPTMKVEARDREVPVAFVWVGRGVVGEDDGEGGAAEELMRWRVTMETGAAAGGVIGCDGYGERRGGGGQG